MSDPDNRVRIPAKAVEMAFMNENEWEKIAQSEIMKVRQIALVSGISYSAVRGRLRKAGFSASGPSWGQVRGLWGLPKKLKEFNAIVDERFPLWLKSVLEEKE